MLTVGDRFPDFRLDPFPHPFTAEPTKGTLLLWPQEADCDAMFIARMIRTAAMKPAKKESDPRTKMIDADPTQLSEE